MTISCADRERIFMDGTPEEWTALEGHAVSCGPCAAEVRGWKELSTAALELREYSDDPALWPRIAKSLAAEPALSSADQSADDAARREIKKAAWLERWARWPLSLGWQTALASALALALLVGGVSIYRHEQQTSSNAVKSPFLNDRTLAEVERAESAYMQAIDKMAAEARPAMDANSPLLDSYREKLMVLDSAIGELRAQTGENPSNAQLRYQLLAMYREKQGTLREILESK